MRAFLHEEAIYYSNGWLASGVFYPQPTTGLGACQLTPNLGERVAGMPGRAPKGIPIKKPNAQRIRRGLVGHVRFLKGEAACAMPL
jgi:hypothetical protein